MPVLSIPEAPSGLHKSPFQKAAPLMISMMNPSGLPSAPSLQHHDSSSSLELDTFGLPKTLDTASASPGPKFLAYQAHLERMSPQKEYKHVNAKTLIAKYQHDHPAPVVDIPDGLLDNDNIHGKHHKHHHSHRQTYPESDDENLDWTESNYEDPLDHDASANDFESFGQPITEHLIDKVQESPKRKMQDYFKILSPRLRTDASTMQAVELVNDDVRTSEGIMGDEQAAPGMPFTPNSHTDANEEATLSDPLQA
jgi:hypothetical protein